MSHVVARSSVARTAVVAVLALASLLLVAPAHAVSTVQEISWPALKRSGQLRVGELVGDAVRVVNRMKRPLSFYLATIEQPRLHGLQWALVGKVRYQACSDDTCYRPAVVEIRLPYEIH